TRRAAPSCGAALGNAAGGPIVWKDGKRQRPGRLPTDLAMSHDNREPPVTRLTLRTLLVGGGLFLFAAAAAAEPPPAEGLPPPRPVAPGPPAVPYAAMTVHRKSAYDVWQNYGVDHYGRFRPRVISTPYGAYYRSNGAPYPWTLTHQNEILPYVVEPATFGGPWR